MTSLHHALGLPSPAAFTVALRRCALELGLAADDADFDAKWQHNGNQGPLPSGCGSSRPFRSPCSEALYPTWQRSRNSRWLYAQGDYAWDAVGCSAYESSDTIRRGIDEGLVARGLQPGRVLDMGAGPGFTTLTVARAFPNAEVHHIDCNPQLNDVFGWFNREHAGLSNCAHVPAPVGTYDLVVCIEFLEHLECIDRPGVGDPMAWLDGALGGILAPEGRLMMHSNWSAEQSGWLTLGHFIDYLFDGAVVSNLRPKAVAHAYRKAMYRRGWRMDFNPTNRSKAPKLWMR